MENIALPKWRRVQSDERFIYGFHDSARNRGYVIQSFVLLNNHETCCCILSKTPVRIEWFLPHSFEWHGQYPVHYTREDELREQLIREKLWLEIGVCMELFPLISYGNLAKQ